MQRVFDLVRNYRFKKGAVVKLSRWFRWVDRIEPMLDDFAILEFILSEIGLWEGWDLEAKWREATTEPLHADGEQRPGSSSDGAGGCRWAGARGRSPAGGCFGGGCSGAGR